jgi:hypothetical protein
MVNEASITAANQEVSKIFFSAAGDDLEEDHVGEIVAKSLTPFSHSNGSDTNRSALIFNVANNSTAEERLRITSDGISLKYNSAAILFGANEHVTLTHVAGQTPGLLLNGSSQLQFRDSAIHISSDADGYMNVQADTGVNLNINGTDRVTVTNTVVAVTATTESTSATTGALIVAGGVSIVKNLTVANITASGTVTSNSDMRLKKDIVEIDNCVDKVKKLRGVNFKWIKDDSEDFGVIAQEVEAIAPHAVKENKEGMKSVDYGRLTTLLIQAVKEQQTQIDELKDLVAKLTNKE